VINGLDTGRFYDVAQGIAGDGHSGTLGRRLRAGLRVSGGFLLAMAVVSLFTGARASLLPYKLCAPIFTVAATLILVGAFLA
jgi:hypothetical protein